ncbi:MAG TPA: DNA-processing protein DprA [Candidatus Acidoferrales bacterium]|nr:DNA-processing protein DprA [Candidatus Acidoferrales bacterium]
MPERAIPFFGRKPSRLWSLGSASLLHKPLLAILSARAGDSKLDPNTVDLIRELGRSQLTFIGGWHSRLEKESFKLLLSAAPPTVICLAKSVGRFGFVPELQALMSRDRLLLLTHCTPNAKRISRDASVRRNRLVAGLAQALLVLSAPEGGETFKLARLAIGLGKPVFAPGAPLNEALLACGALAANEGAIREALK